MTTLSFPYNGLDGPPRSGAHRFAGEPAARGRARSARWELGLLQLPPGGRPLRPLSVIVDALGVHYDATAPSEIERRLSTEGWETPELIRRAQAGMERLRRIRAGGSPVMSGPRVVVIDQAVDDPAVGFGLAGPARFVAMMKAAVVENPGALIEVLAPAGGLGHLGELPPGVVMSAPAAPDPTSGLAHARRIYTVSSTAAFEAVLAGSEVTCFGAPFFAGWGLTDDRLQMHRRTRSRTAAEVFAAACLLGSRYFSPYTGVAIELEQALDVLETCLRRARENACSTLAIGFAAWKRSWVEATLGGAKGQPRIAPAGSVVPEDLAGLDRVVSWASREPEGAEAVCARENVPLLRMEDGFLRSVGLGVGLRPGASYVLDGRGVYYDATRPSDLETLLQTTLFDEELLDRAARLRRDVVAAGLSKYNVGSQDLPRLPADREIVLVAGQVEDDASVRRGLVTVEGNAGLLRRVRETRPDAFIAYKPHPDVEAGLRPGRIPAPTLTALCDVVLRDCASPAAIGAADRVEVASSLLGFEALLRGKPVTTHGMPFYAGWGLTTDPGCARRTRRLELDELVAAALILYPRYLDPVTGVPCEPEVLVRRLAQSAGPSKPRLTLEGVGKRLWSAGYRAGRADRL